MSYGGIDSQNNLEAVNTTGGLQNSCNTMHDVQSLRHPPSDEWLQVSRILSYENKQTTNFMHTLRMTLPTKQDIAQCTTLEQNNPTVTSLDFVLNGYTAQLYGEALQGNTSIDYLRIVSDDVDSADCDPKDYDLFVNFLEISQRLTRIDLHHIRNHCIVDRFLKSISNSNSINEVRLFDCHITVRALKVLLRSSKFLTKFWIENVIILDGSSIESNEATIFHINTSIASLILFGLNDACKVITLKHFNDKSNLNFLRIGDDSFTASQYAHIGVDFACCIKSFLKTSVALQKLDFCTIRFESPPFRYVVNGVNQCSSLKELSFDNCQLTGNDCLEMFYGIFQSVKSSITTLRICGNTRFGIPVSTVLSNILSSKPKNSPLWKIDLDLAYNKTDFDSILDLNQLFSKLSVDSSVQHLCLGSVDSPRRYDEIVRWIPRLRGLTTIEFDIVFNIDNDDQIESFVHAVKKNGSFESIDNCIASIFDETDDEYRIAKLRTYCARNAWIHHSMGDPDNVSPCLLPWIFICIQDYHYQYDVLFNILRLSTKI